MTPDDLRGLARTRVTLVVNVIGAQDLSLPDLRFLGSYG